MSAEAEPTVLSVWLRQARIYVVLLTLLVSKLPQLRSQAGVT